MASPQTTVTLRKTLSFDENRWVIQIREFLDEELEDDHGIDVCIFQVPKPLLSTKPDHYIPQQVALGPYHHWSTELYDMEMLKLAASRRTQKQFQNLTFDDLVKLVEELDPLIRACYDKYLNFAGETLAWMMTIDACFLLEFLQTYSAKEAAGKRLTKVSSKLSHLIDYAGKKLAHNVILKDIMMLENQIPLLVLEKILEFQYSSLEVADDVLSSMLTGLHKELSPFKITMEGSPSFKVTDSLHLLDFLYRTIVPLDLVLIKTEDQEISQLHANDAHKDGEGSFANPGHVKKLFNVLVKLLSKLNKGPIRIVKRVIISKPLKLVGKLPWTVLTKIPGISIIKGPVEALFSSEQKEDVKPEEGSGATDNINKPPLIEEITVPSVTQLAECGVRFSPIKNGDISSIRFDRKTVTLHLPTTSLDVNTEVILRNLVAYEASSSFGAVVFTRYTELMNGIIDTEEDAKLLREKGIILNRLKSDKEVADLWNGMSKSVRLTKVPHLDKVIEDVNKYYGSRWSVKARMMMRNYVLGSWQLLTILAAILLLLLMVLQSFCSVYSCGRIFHFKITE